MALGARFQNVTSMKNPQETPLVALSLINVYDILLI